MNRWLSKVFDWLRPQAPAPVRRRRVAIDPPKLPKSRSWTGADSKTRQDILAVLQYAATPLTRHEISARLGVTTAGIHLPRMVKDRMVRLLPNTWPYQYVACEMRSEPSESEASDAHAHTKQRFYRVM